MAYGLKYELLFSDVKGNRRKIQILKKDYVGAVLPIIGTGDPITIEWFTDDDIYEPIIGSMATLNMSVTDSVTYDDFFLYGEKEYQLVLLHEDGVNNFVTYWKGFITNDIYSQAINTTPYTISLTATDGLGALDGFDSWYPETGENTQVLWKYIWKNLQLTGLDLDIWVSDDLRYTSPTWKNVFNEVSIYKESVFQKNYTIRNAKDILRSILLAFNCRIFQSEGHWNIVNSSTYGDQRIIQGIQDGTYSGAGILVAKKGFLNGGSEDIKYWRYNKDGAELGTSTYNFLRTIPLNTIPTSSNMVRNVRRPLRRYQSNLDISQKRLDYNYNASFEFLTENWVFPNGATIVDDPFSGKKAVQQTLTTDITNVGTELAFRSINAEYANKFDQCQILISVKCSVPNGSRIPFYVKVFDGVNDWYYSKSFTDGWATAASIFWEYQDLEDTTLFQEFKISPPIFQSSGQIEIGIGKMQTVGGVSAVMVYDNIAVRNNSKEANEYQTIQFIRQQTNEAISSDIMEHSDIYVGNVLSGVFWGNLVNYPTFKRCNDATFRPLEEIVTQQRINDFQQYQKAYEAELYPTAGVIHMANKVYINFATLSETDSCLIDAIKYNVKANRYDVKMHIPTNYNDVSSSFRASFVS